jgi:Flp pilus assembly protein TadG
MKERVSQLCGFLRAHRRGDAGQALVETALTMPLMILLLLGAAELARVAYAAIEVSNAAKAAAQFGAQNSSTSADITGMGIAAAGDAANLTNFSSAVTSACSCVTAGTSAAASCASTSCKTGGGYLVQTLTITTSTTFDPLIHLWGLPNTFTLHGHAVQEVLR